MLTHPTVSEILNLMEEVQQAENAYRKIPKEFFIAIGIFLLLLGSIGLFLFTRSRPQEKNTQAASTPTPVQSTIYTNQTLGFSFSHPQNFDIHEMSDSATLSAGRFHEVILLSQEDDESPTPPLSLYYYDNPNNYSIPDFNTKYFSQPVGNPLTIWEKGYDEVSNSNGIQGYFDKKHLCETPCQIYVFSTNSKVFVLKKTASKKEPVDTVFKQIFSTLKFN